MPRCAKKKRDKVPRSLYFYNSRTSDTNVSVWDLSCLNCGAMWGKHRSKDDACPGGLDGWKVDFHKGNARIYNVST